MQYSNADVMIFATINYKNRKFYLSKKTKRSLKLNSNIKSKRFLKFNGFAKHIRNFRMFFEQKVFYFRRWLCGSREHLQLLRSGFLQTRNSLSTNACWYLAYFFASNVSGRSSESIAKSSKLKFRWRSRKNSKKYLFSLFLGLTKINHHTLRI